MASIHTANAVPRRALRPWALAVLFAAAWSLVAASRGEAHVSSRRVRRRKLGDDDRVRDAERAAAARDRLASR